MAELAVAFADLAGFTALTEVHGDEDAADVAGAFYSMAQSCLVGDTRLVKRIGDAVMLVGGSPDDALASVLGLVAAVEARPDFPGVRAGVHFGHVASRDGDVFGATVNVAARVAAHARSGQTLCTAALRDALARGRWRAMPLGETKLRNVLLPVELFELDDGPRSAERDLDPVCRMHLPPGSAWWLEHDGRTIRFCSAKCRDAFAAAPESFV
ncbi:MAG: YHS domain-containing protein [Polyangiaceae bacterium]|nr:YHS domain-containing protein [Polyangiaceae bacterium]